MSRLEISLLGAFGVRLDGEPVTRFETDAARVLLAYLAMNPGVTFSREKIAGMFWPEYPLDAALKNLRATVLRLRRAIGDDADVSGFLDITRHTILFEPHSDYWLDVKELTTLLSAIQGHTHRRPSACPVCVRRMEWANTFYRDGLLPDYNLDSSSVRDWLTAERQALHRQMMDVLRQLWDYAYRRADYSKAEAYVRRQLDLEPWREEAHRRLMYLLALKGERSAALAQYRLCSNSLREVLGVDPGPQTKELHEVILLEQDLPTYFGASTPLHNLPAQLTSFVGRESEMRRLAEWLTDPDNRLVTVTGLGGVGKTRLVLAAAREMIGIFEHGVWWISLADFKAASLPEQDAATGKAYDGDGAGVLVDALSSVLRLPYSDEGERGKRLLNYLREREALLVIDRFEYLAETGRDFILSLLRSAPRVCLLITSRRRLNLQVERFLELSGLPVPGPGFTLPDKPGKAEAGYASLRLFTERAGRVGRPFVLNEDNLPGVIEICRLVEGMPLAIELAAARTSSLSPVEITQAVRADLENLSATLHDLPGRHRSVRLVFESSWDMLSPEQGQALARLAVFRGGFDFRAAEQVAEATPEILDSLVDHSLLRMVPGGRLDMHELLRQFAEEKLEALEDANQIRDRHCAYYLTYLGEWEVFLYGELPQTALIEMDRDWENINQAWEWAAVLGRIDDLQLGLNSLARFCNLKGQITHCKRMLSQTIEALNRRMEEITGSTELDRAKRLLSRLLLVQAGVLISLGEDAQGEAICRQVLGLFKEVPDSEVRVGASLLLSTLYRRQGHFEVAFAQIGDLLSGSTLLLDQRVLIYHELGELFFDQGRMAEAEKNYRQALAIYQQTGDAIGRIKATNSLGRISYQRGRPEEALRYCLEFLELSRSLGDRVSEADALSNLGLVYMSMGEAVKSKHYLERALDLSRTIGDRQEQAENLMLLGQFWQWRADLDVSWRHLQEARELFASMGRRNWEIETSLLLGELYLEKGDFQLSDHALSSALEFFRRIDRPDRCARCYAGLAQVAFAEGRSADALELVEQALPILEGMTDEGIVVPLSVHLASVKLLHDIQDTRADELLRSAWLALQTQAERIEDPGLRESFMDNVPAHREITRLYKGSSEGGQAAI